MTQDEILSQQQLIVNRYATVGRSSHHFNNNNGGNNGGGSYFSTGQYYQPQQQQTIQAQVLQQDEPSQKRRTHRQHSGSNDSLAARINRDLTSDQVCGEDIRFFVKLNLSKTWISWIIFRL